MAKKNALISVSMLDNGAIEFHVGNVGSILLDTPNLAEDVRNRAMVHGLVQKVSDAAAIAKSELPGDANEAARMKLAAMRAVADRLAEGEWSKRSGEGSGPVSGLIFRAFSEWATDMAKKAKKPAPTAEQLRAAYDSRDRAGQLALRNVPAIAEIIERMKAERGATAAKSVDADALLSELGL